MYEVAPAIDDLIQTYRESKNYWPKNHGFDGQPYNMELEPGTQVDRYGKPTGQYASPAGTPFEQRSLPESSNNPSKLHTYEIVKSIKVKAGTTAAWRDQPGKGTQYYFSKSISKYILSGHMREIE